MTRVYLPGAVHGGGTVMVPARAAHHIVHVLRLRPGSVIRVFDGEGREWSAILREVRRGTVCLELGAIAQTIDEPVLDITLAQGIARNDRMDIIIQKSVELGVSRFQPLWLQRCQNRLAGDRLDKRLKHWRGIIISACEQCGRATLPELCLPEEYPAWLDRQDAGSLKLLLQPDGGQTLSGVEHGGRPVTVLVGPEGGLASDEQLRALNAGYTGVRLGQRVLRTETAAITALASLQALWGDFCRPGA